MVCYSTNGETPRATNDPVFMVDHASRVPSAVLPAPSRRSSLSNPFLHENPRREGVAGLGRGKRAARGRGDFTGRVLSDFGARGGSASVLAGPQRCAPGARSALGGSLFRFLFDSCSILFNSFFCILDDNCLNIRSKVDNRKELTVHPQSAPH